MPTIDERQFRDALLWDFPQVVADTAADDGIHLIVAEFRRYTEGAILHEDRELFIGCIQFVDRMFSDGNEVVRNAVALSFLKHLHIDHSGAEWAKELLSEDLAKERDAVMSYMRQFSAPAQTTSPRHRKDARRTTEGRRRHR